MDRSKSSRTITFRGGRIAAVLIVIAATLCLLLSVSAAGDAALPAWAEPYLLMDTVTKTEGSFFTSSTVLDGRLLFFAQYSKHSGLWSTDGTTAGTWQIAQHLEQWDPGAPVSLDTVAVFAAETSDAGRELWVTSGNIGDPHMLLDVAPGADSSDPDLLTRMGDHVYFRANDGNTLWRTDGTAAGTVKIKTFGYEYSNISIRDMAGADGHLFLWAFDENGMPTFWSSDGTTTGTIKLHAFDPNAGVPVPPLLMTVGNLGFARNQQELWRSDGTLAGTFKITNAPLHTFSMNWASGETILYMFAHDFWANKGEVWTSDGTVAGTRKMADIGTRDPLDVEMVTSGDRLYFSHATVPYGRELWTSDGTPGGTMIVKDIMGGPSDSGPYSLVVVDDEVYFTIFGGEQLWRSDGTAAGTQRVLLDTSNPMRPGYWPVDAFQGRLFAMVTDDLHGTEPWFSDGTTQGSFMLKDINKANQEGSIASGFTFYRNRIYFIAHGGLWVSDGGVDNAMELTPPRNNEWYVPQSTQSLISSNGLVYFVVENIATQGIELWRTDGAKAGTIRLKQLISSSYSDPIRELTDLNGVLYFLERKGETNNKLWRSNGTPAGTIALDLFPSTTDPANWREFTASGPFLYFAANSALGGELWRTNGTRLGTGMPADINPGQGSSNPTYLTDMGGILYFAADDGRLGRELWRSDGTIRGTYLVKDINPAADAGSTPNAFVVMHNTLYFLANDGTHGMELWRSDGTAAGTRLVKDAVPGGGHPPALELVAGRDRVFFRAVTGEFNYYRPWVSDGTAAGTLQLQLPTNKPEDYYPAQMTAADNTLFFVLYPDNNTLYRSDGMTTATVALNEAFPTFSHSSPFFLTGAPGRLIFSAVSVYGNEPYVALTSLVTLSPNFLDLSEGGDAKNVTMMLNRPPVVPVTINLSSNDTLIFTPDTLTFTAAEWSTPRTVSIRAPGDEIDQGTRPAIVQLNITSSDAIFVDNTHSLPVIIHQEGYRLYMPLATR